MTFSETCLNKISRVTQNPNLWYSGKRFWRCWLKLLYHMGLYKIPDTPILKNWVDKASLHLRKGEFPTRRLWFSFTFIMMRNTSCVSSSGRG